MVPTVEIMISSSSQGLSTDPALLSALLHSSKAGSCNFGFPEDGRLSKIWGFPKIRGT